MYATLYHAVKDLFGLEIPFLKMVMMFGFFVALAFLAAHWAMTSELKRKEREGVIKPFQKKLTNPNPVFEYALSTILGFIAGWKISYMAGNFTEVTNNPQDFILSTKGYVIWGVVGAIAFAAYKFFELKKAPKIEEGQTALFHPYMMMGNLTILAAVAGFSGAKLFHHLEHFTELVADPMVLFRDPFSGLTFFGGLIGGAIAVLWYANKHNVKWRTMLDVGAPAMMLSYGVGRMGCHMSGDGDWGIENLAPKPDWMSFLPDWTWAYDYAGNVHGTVLPNPVWPTPMYEVIMALGIFGFLWAIRKRIKIEGVLFSIYLILSGLERGLIETIRVNPRDWFGGRFTQAEVISTTFVILGIAGIIYFTKFAKKNPPLVEVDSNEVDLVKS